MSTLQDAIDEIKDLAERDRLAREREAYINDDFICLTGAIVGKLADLPLWAQAYIKDMRAKLWDARNDR